MAVATVDTNGRVTAIGNGTAVITATTNSGGFTASCTITVTTYTSGGGNSGGSSDGSSSGSSSFAGGTTTPAVTIPEKKPDQPVTVVVSVMATSGTGGAAASAAIPDKTITDAIAKAQSDAKSQGKTANGISVVLNITMPRKATAFTATLTRNSLNSLVSAGVTSFEINGSPATMAFDKKALAEIREQGSGNINIAVAPQTNLSASAKELIGTRPVYNITISCSSGKTVSNLDGGVVTVSIPYTPAKDEVTSYLYGVYVDANGNAIRIAGSAYEANSNCVIFTTNHFSLYGIGYTAPSAKFTDIRTHWGKESIDYVVGKGLLSGTSATTFTPDAVMTREMLVTALGRLACIDVNFYTESSFTDVKTDSAYRPYIEWAYQNGIIQGIGNSQFAPDRAISREEIAAVFTNYAKATGYTLPVNHEATIYADADRIGSMYKIAITAMQQAGIMMGGTGNEFNSKSNSTRAEVSSMLYRYIKLTIGS
ncbi:Endo-1,4-beta-xylanase A precursor [Sporanaerobacter sp. PP17-6a]|nr:Endo-1,4-beta-xylanase A precursor [Sporanaerobacter sp. PP17-6a]